MFCKHKWSEKIRTVTPELSHIKFDDMFMYSSDRERLLFGVTSILWECEKCPKTRIEELLGKEVKK